MKPYMTQCAVPGLVSPRMWAGALEQASSSSPEQALSSSPSPPLMQEMVGNKRACTTGGASSSGTGTEVGLATACFEEPRKSKQPRTTFKCSVCGAQPFTSMFGFTTHLEYSPVCEDEDATMTEYDPGAAREAAFHEQAMAAGYQEKLRDHLIDSYTSLEYVSLVPRTTIQDGIKCNLVGGLLDVMKDEIKARVARVLPDGDECKAVDSIVEAVFDVHKGIETAARENTVMRDLYLPVSPAKRALVDAPGADGTPTGPRSGDFCYDVPISAELAKMAELDPGLLMRLKAAADAWAAERPQPGQSRIYSDFPDGKVMQDHPTLGIAADRSDGSCRLAIILYYDDLEVCNPLGAFHGKHKLGLFYWALVNVDKGVRMQFENLHLMTVAFVHDIDYYGINQIVSGLPGDTSFGSGMTALDAGVTIHGQLVRGWCICLAADFPAAALCAGFKKSATAIKFCRECDCSHHDEDYPCPNSFLDANSHLECKFLLRDWLEYKEQLEHWQSLSTAATHQKKYADSLGCVLCAPHAPRTTHRISRTAHCTPHRMQQPNNLSAS